MFHIGVLLHLMSAPWWQICQITPISKKVRRYALPALEGVMNHWAMFDMDGTLVDTDAANNQAYIKAMEQFFGYAPEWEASGITRITKSSLSLLLPNANAKQIYEISKLKNKFFDEFLCATTVIEKTIDYLKYYSNKNRAVLVTHSNPQRAKSVLKHYGLDIYFCHGFYGNINYMRSKYAIAADVMGLEISEVIIFENEIQQVELAIKSGFDKNKITIIIWWA